MCFTSTSRCGRSRGGGYRTAHADWRHELRHEHRDRQLRKPRLPGEIERLCPYRRGGTGPDPEERGESDHQGAEGMALTVGAAALRKDALFGAPFLVPPRTSSLDPVQQVGLLRLELGFGDRA